MMVGWSSRFTSIMMDWGCFLNCNDHGSGSRTMVESMLFDGLSKEILRVFMN